MSAKPLIEALEKILLLHKSLNKIAADKTDIIKKGDTEALNTLLKDEKKHIQAIQKYETERQKVSAEFLIKFGKKNNNPSISDCIEVASSSEKQRLEKLKTELYTQVKRLSETNKLNQELLQQSLQFVNLSLDLLMPDIDTYNYERPGQAQQYEDGRSIFNSKV